MASEIGLSNLPPFPKLTLRKRPTMLFILRTTPDLTTGRLLCTHQIEAASAMDAISKQLDAEDDAAGNPTEHSVHFEVRSARREALRVDASWTRQTDDQAAVLIIRIAAVPRSRIGG